MGVGGQRNPHRRLYLQERSGTRWLGIPQGRSGRGAENLVPTGIRSPDRPARSELLYWMTSRPTNNDGVKKKRSVEGKILWGLQSHDGLRQCYHNRLPPPAIPLDLHSIIIIIIIIIINSFYSLWSIGHPRRSSDIAVSSYPLDLVLWSSCASYLMFTALIDY